MKKLILAITVLSLAAAAPLRADEIASAKKIFADKQDSVIWITGVAKITLTASGGSEGMPSIPEQEEKVMALGTIVGSDGVVVTMLSAIDPASQVKGRSVRTEGGMVKLDATSVMKELKVVMPDGTEIPCELVMKDVNLDLAVIRIKTSSKEASGMVYHPIDLKDNAEGHILDEVVTIARMPEIFNRVPTVAVGHIGMVTKKPRVFLRADGAIGGCPTFNTDGKLIGITAGRTKGGRVVEAAIIPAADVMDVVEQSKNKKAEAEEPAKAEDKSAKPAGTNKNDAADKKADKEGADKN
jgi:S1-C subfamily serine protease